MPVWVAGVEVQYWIEVVGFMRVSGAEAGGWCGSVDEEEEEEEGGGGPVEWVLGSEAGIACACCSLC